MEKNLHAHLEQKCIKIGFLHGITAQMIRHFYYLKLKANLFDTKLTNGYITSMYLQCLPYIHDVIVLSF